MLITAKTNEGGDLITGKEKYFFLYSGKSTGLLFAALHMTLNICLFVLSETLLEI